MRCRAVVARLLAALAGGAILATPGPAVAGTPAPGSAPLERLAFLLGTWEASGAGGPGAPSGRATFALGLQGRVMIRTSYAETPATPTAAPSRHDDLLVIHEIAGGGLGADYYDNEGHVIRYAGGIPAEGAVTFVSDIVEGSPRYQLSYRLGPDGVLKGTFSIAPPGKPEGFVQYLAWESRRALSDAERPR